MRLSLREDKILCEGERLIIELTCFIQRSIIYIIYYLNSFSLYRRTMFSITVGEGACSLHWWWSGGCHLWLLPQGEAYLWWRRYPCHSPRWPLTQRSVWTAAGEGEAGGILDGRPLDSQWSRGTVKVPWCLQAGRRKKGRVCVHACTKMSSLIFGFKEECIERYISNQ